MINLRVCAAMLSISGILFSGCSTADRGAAVVAPVAARPSGIIRSQSDLQRYLSATANSGSPLSALSNSARTRFLSSVTFNEKGITGFRYADLQSELTASQIFDVLQLFGVERDLKIIPNVRVETAADRRVVSDYFDNPGDVGNGPGPDYKNYWCFNRGTCNPSDTSICTSNC